MGKVNIKQLNYAPDTGYVIGSGAGGVPIWKVEGGAGSVAWPDITGNQADINLSGFTNDSNFITLTSLSAGTGISYNNLTGVISSNLNLQNVLDNGSTSTGHTVQIGNQLFGGVGGRIILARFQLPNIYNTVDLGGTQAREVIIEVNCETDFSRSGTFLQRRSRGTSTIPNAVAEDDRLGAFVFAGHDGTSYQNGAGINAFADGTPSTGNTPIAIHFQTGTNTGNRTTRLAVPSGGGVTIGTGTFTPTAGVLNTDVGFRIADGAASGHYLRGNGTNFVSSLIQASDITTAGGITGSLTTGYLPKAASASSLTNSLLYETGQTVAVGTNTGIDAFSRFYVFGGTNGANLDVRPGGGGYNQAIIDLQSDDFSSNFISTFLVHQGSGIAGTTWGTSNAELGRLVFNGYGSQIQSFAPLQIGTFNSGEVMRVQDGGVTIGSQTATASAILEASSTSQGFLSPRMTTAQKNAIGSPATGLQLVDTDLDRPVYKTASGWESLAFLTDVSAPTITLSGDVSGSGTTSITTTIGNNTVNDAKLRQSAGLSVIGRSANSTGNVADITSTTNGHFLVQRSNALGFGALVDADIPAASASKWTTTGSDIYRNSKVRIGSTASPTAQLEIRGLGNTNSTVSFAVDNSSADPMFIVRDNTRVGIGTFAPSNELTIKPVAGNSSAFRLEASTGGGYMRAGSANDAEFGAGYEFVSSVATARATSASGVNFFAGGTYFVGNTGLTVGNTFTPTYRLFISNTGNVAIGATTATSKLDVLGDVEIRSTDAFYLGDPTTDGTWRIVRSGNDLLSQRREAGSYVTKQTITP